MKIFILSFAFAALALVALGCTGEQQEKGSVLGKGLIGNLSPQEALKTFKLPKGFRIELVASEPEIMDPVDMAIDEDGIMYVVEMADYPREAPDGKVKRLEDADGDGRFERVTRFADNIPYPNGIMLWKGGILVTAAPDILYFKDTNGDGKADVRKIVYTGFSKGNPQHIVNGLRYAVDNWIYGNNGDSNGEIRPGSQSSTAAISIQGTDFRFRPDFSRFEPAAGHSQHGNTFDDWGNRFCGGHIGHPVLPLRYLTRNPYLAVPEVVDYLDDHTKVFPISKIEERLNDPETAGHFTAPSGVTVYLGSAFPAPYQGNAFTCESAHNLVHRDDLVIQGASFMAKRVDREVEFLASIDNWFRPVNLYVGPDGALYVVDMYRAVIEHPEWIPLEMQRKLDLRAGYTRGRIYRVVHESTEPMVIPRLSTASTVELVAHLENANAWWRMTAQRLLVERQDNTAIEPLQKLARTSKSPLGKLHSLWTLEGLNALGPGLVESALKGPDAGLRENALRLAEPLLAESGSLREAVLGMADDPHPAVRFQLAFTLGEMKEQRALDALTRILVSDAGDRWVRMAVLSSVANATVKLLSRLQSGFPDFLDEPQPGTLEVVRQMADVIGQSRNKAKVGEWLKLAAEVGAEASRWRIAAIAGIVPSLRNWGIPMEELLEESGVSKQVAKWTPRLMEMALDSEHEADERANAIDLLAFLHRPELAPRLEKLLNPHEPVAVQVAAARALESWPGDSIGKRLIAGWATYTRPVRQEVIEALFSRPDQINKFLDLLEQGEIQVSELAAHHREQLLENENAAVRERAKKLFATKADFEKLIRELNGKVLHLRGDPVRGEKAYMENCMICHRHHGQGYNVGPDLESLAGRDKKAIITDILNPNRVIEPAYQEYVIKTRDRRMISGIISAETPTSITLKRSMAEKTTVLRRDIVEIKAHPASLMPEDLHSALTHQEFADLLEFLHRDWED